MEAKFCPQCGTPRVGKFCGKCGFSFGTSQPSQPEASDLQDELGRSIRALPNGLIRGEGFDPVAHCDNCGLKLNKQSECKECGD